MKYTIKSRTRLLFNSLIVLICLMTLGINGSSQCDGVYQKPISYQILPGGASFGDTWGKPAIDLTGDGVLDLVGLVFDYNTSRLIIYPGNGDLTFGAPLLLSAPEGGYAYQNRFLDLNSDGLPDVIFEFGNNQISLGVNLNDGQGNFTTLPTFSLGTNEHLWRFIELNGDKAIDLLTYAYSNNQVYHFYKPGNGDGTFGPNVPLPSLNYMGWGDFDGDGSVDILTYDNGFTVFFNDGHGNFTPAAATVSIPNYWDVIGDLNNDGRTDLISKDFFNSKMGISLSNGDGTFTTSSLYDLQYIQSYLPYVQSVNLNGDSAKDLMANSGFYYDVFINDGTGHFTGRHYDVPLRGRLNWTPGEDFDNDGRADFLSFDTAFGDTRVIIWKNSCEAGQTKTVDFDRDRITEKTLWNEDTGLWRFQKNSNTWVAPGQPVRWGTSGDIPVPGDYDGDLATDMAVFRPSNGVWYVYNPATESASYTNFGIASDKPVASDYDGDGKTDIAVYRPSEGNWYILSSATGQYSIVRFGLSEDRPVPADYDGDGRSDIAVFRPSTGVWYVLRSSDGNFTGANWGVGTDIPVPADYDGDGKADLTVFRPAEGNWYLLRSYNNQNWVLNLGMPGDIPQPGDWDGNGIMDLGVYRPATNTWYAWNETVFGSAGDRPVSSVLPAN